MGSSNKSISEYPRPLQEVLNEAISLQQNMYELSADWNYYKESQHEYLKKNIRYAVCGPPDIATEKPINQDDLKKARELAVQDKLIDLIYSKILEVSRMKKSLYVGTIFNIVCNVNKKNEKCLSAIPIFKVKRCMEKEGGSILALKTKNNPETNSKKIGTTALYSYCVYYIDIEGRIYQNWTEYVTKNTLPACTMVLPMGGYYQGNPEASNSTEKTYVWVEIGPSRAANKILPILDVAGAALGVGALGVGLVGLVAPIAAPIVFAGTVCGTASGLYATTRSTQQLVDRHKHQQSISITDRTARSAWFGVAGGLAAGLASGSTFVLNKAAQAGMTVGNVGRGTHNVIGIGNLIVNGMGITNGVYGIYQNYSETEEYSVLEIGQVIAHVLFFGNAVMNFQTARTIIDNTQQRVIQEYETSLRSNRHKKAFRRIRRNTHATSSDTISADSEIIRGIRSIQNKHDFFAGIVRNRKIFNSNKAEVTFKDGYAMINDNIKFDPVELSQQPIEIRGNTVSAAQPFETVVKSALPQSNKMTVSAYNEQVSLVSTMIDSIFGMARAAMASDRLLDIGRLILDMDAFIQDDRDSLIKRLAKLALRIIKEHRVCITKSLEGLMNIIWFRYVRPKVDILLQEMSIDASAMSQFPDIAEIVYEIAQTVISEIYDGIENFLEAIIEYYEDEAVALRSNKCSECSGYVLSDP